MEHSALVIRAERDMPLGDLLAVARAEAKKRHGLKRGRIEIVEMFYVPRLSVHVALYRAPEVRGRRLKSEK